MKPALAATWKQPSTPDPVMITSDPARPGRAANSARLAQHSTASGPIHRAWRAAPAYRSYTAAPAAVPSGPAANSSPAAAGPPPRPAAAGTASAAGTVYTATSQPNSMQVRSRRSAEDQRQGRQTGRPCGALPAAAAGRATTATRISSAETT